MRNVLRAVAVVVLLGLCGGVLTAGEGMAAQDGGKKAVKAANCNLLNQTVVSVNTEKNALTVKGKDGAEQEVMLSKDVAIKEGKKKMALGDVSAGERVSVYYKKSKDGQMVPSTVKMLKSKTK